MLHSVGLAEGLLNEPLFPPLKSSCASTKNSITSLLPCELGTQHEDLHEERLVELVLGFLQHLVEQETEVPYYA
jgi:hypothetical protein